MLPLIQRPEFRFLIHRDLAGLFREHPYMSGYAEPSPLIICEVADQS